MISNGGLSGNITNGTTDFIYNPNWQCVEERDGMNSVFKQYVHGRYIDEIVQLKTFTTINGNAAGEYYPCQDLLYRTMALLNSSGAIVEAYDYDAYGNTLIFTAAGTGGDWWADDATQGDEPTLNCLFTGLYYDPEVELHDARTRRYDAPTGRFSSRDWIGYIAGPMNIYEFAYINPTRYLDPFGTWPPAGESTMLLGGGVEATPSPRGWKLEHDAFGETNINPNIGREVDLYNIWGEAPRFQRGRCSGWWKTGTLAIHIHAHSEITADDARRWVGVVNNIWAPCCIYFHLEIHEYTADESRTLLSLGPDEDIHAFATYNLLDPQGSFARLGARTKRPQPWRSIEAHIVPSINRWATATGVTEDTSGLIFIGTVMAGGNAYDLAHELGHALGGLDHVFKPWRLMAHGTFNARIGRLTQDECCAARESGYLR